MSQIVAIYHHSDQCSVLLCITVVPILEELSLLYFKAPLCIRGHMKENRGARWTVCQRLIELRGTNVVNTARLSP